MLEQMYAEEATAWQSIRFRCWPGEVRCLRCGAEVYALREGRWRCSVCCYTFGLFTGRWLARCGFSARQWLLLVDLLVRETPLREISAQLHVAYNTAYKGAKTIRQALAATSAYPLPTQLLHADDIDPVFPPVFGFHNTSAGWHMVHIDALPVQSLWTMGLSCSRCGNIVITSAFQQFPHLVFCATPALCRMCGHDLEDIPHYVFGTSEFWDFACPRIHRFQGITPERFPLYLKEMEWRWNAGTKKRLCDIALDALCRRIDPAS
ncbi:MAG: hypothetical protein ACQESV_01740 [Thermodesulfobacteriota bacterium]